MTFLLLTIRMKYTASIEYMYELNIYFTWKFVFKNSLQNT